MTRAELLRRVDSRELTDWMLLYRVEEEERKAQEQQAAA